MSAAIDLEGGELRLSAPTALFPLRVSVGGVKRQYQVSREGERFLVNSVLEGSTPRLLTVILNWSPRAGVPGRP